MTDIPENDTYQEIVARIREKNLSTDAERIPTSDVIFTRLCPDLANSEDKLNDKMAILTESHQLFELKIVEGDELKKIPNVVGYLAADVNVISKLRDYYLPELEKVYVGRFYEQKQATIIIREMVTEARNHNNTPFGKMLNIGVMLMQYEHLLARNFSEYTDVWKATKFNEIMSEFSNGAPTSGGTETGPEPESSTPESSMAAPEEPSLAQDMSLTDQDSSVAPPAEMSGIPTPAPPPSPPQRAVDVQSDLASIEHMELSGKWGAAVEKFGVEFLIRIHLRKYEFEKILMLVRTKRIARESDLRFILSALIKMIKNIRHDPELHNYGDEIDHIRKLVMHKIELIEESRG